MLFRSSERRALEEQVRALDDSPTAQGWRLHILALLYASGQSHLEDELVAVVLKHGEVSNVAAVASALLAAETAVDLPTRFWGILEQAAYNKVPLAPFVMALGVLVHRGQEELSAAARRLAVELKASGKVSHERLAQELLDSLAAAEPE